MEKECVSGGLTSSADIETQAKSAVRYTKELRDHSGVKGTHYSFRGTDFNSQHPCQMVHNCLQLQPQGL